MATKHGGRHTSEYKIWERMLHRCKNPNNERYARYGGRGIKVCERWQESFANFLADMGPRPSPKHTVDRIDNDGHYEPSNCRWATQMEQTRNSSRTKDLTLNGETMCMTAWAQRLGITQHTLNGRLKRGWPLSAALTVGPVPKGYTWHNQKGR